MPRLLLVDTSDQLPGLLPLHSWSAVASSDLVLIAAPEHPFAPHLAAADLPHEVVPPAAGDAELGRADLLAGLSPRDKGRARWIVERVGSHGEVAYLFGAGDTEAFTRTLGMEAARAGVEVEVVYFGVAPKGIGLLELVRIEERLRGPGGCPWDREQDHRSLAPYAVEEVYELSEAIARGDPEAVREELGDVLLQVVFQAQVAEDEGTFDIDAVARGISDKLVRRHPHVFGDTEVADAGEVMARWEELKAAEKPERDGPFDGIPTAQPALGYAAQLQARAAKLGVEPPAGDLPRGLEERLRAAGGESDEAGIGELLMAAIALARRHGVDPELALRAAAGRFRERAERDAGAADG